MLRVFSGVIGSGRFSEGSFLVQVLVVLLLTARCKLSVIATARPWALER